MCIELSKQHGVNPSIEVCFYCGEDKAVVLFGRIKEKDEYGRAIRNSDVEAPKRVFLNYEPCEKCKEVMNKGITFVEVTEEQPKDGRPPVQEFEGKQLYPTGRWCVARPDISAKYKAGDKVLVFTENYKSFIGEN